VIVVVATNAMKGGNLTPELGEQLVATRLALAKKIIALSSSARLVEISADHMFNEEDPQVVIDAVRGVIELSP